MAKVEIKIGLEVLSSLVPQRGMLNAKAEDLEGQKFVLHSMVVRPTKEGKAGNKDLAKPTGDTLFVKARYINEKTKKAFLVPIRGLLGLDVASLPTKNAKFDPASTPTEKLADQLMEKATDTAPATLPESFTVVAVTNRIQESSGQIMYPPYVYEEFVNAVETLRADDKEADLGPIYQDVAFMQSLYGGTILDRFKNVEPNKNIVIAL